ncbi:hypothetical protein AVEN_165140-1 [Araneus ventricosus]|uniref:Reverse transcriptase/retrotransposon-derived protein RNase H-like domain-containing protein n=1 Tax=Araneus ventricosus TaxID=182803 RepID=A0A4Y2B5C2_ARAVE|nr:hypothetical protein AVEN_165140-1 [Araneus ventricosus]
MQQVQACLHDLVKGKVKRDKTPIIWTEESREAFQACKELLAKATMLAYPKVKHSTITRDSCFGDCDWCSIATACRGKH